MTAGPFVIVGAEPAQIPDPKCSLTPRVLSRANRLSPRSDSHHPLLFTLLVLTSNGPHREASVSRVATLPNCADLRPQAAHDADFPLLWLHLEYGFKRRIGFDFAAFE